VDENIAVIVYHPAGTGGTFMMNGTFAQFSQIMLNFITDSGELTRAFTAADDKIVSESTYFTDIQ